MTENVPYIDSKANDVKSFDLISNMMWRRAKFLLNEKFKRNEQILVVDPCAGGGKLLSEMDKSYMGKAYEPNYSPFVYAKSLFSQHDYQVEVVNQPFEFHFTLPTFPENHLVISIPYTDRDISSIESCKNCRQFKNYAYYIMNKSMDILQEGGFGIFAIPTNLMDRKKFEFEVDCLTSKASILSIEEYKEYAIIVLQKDKLN